MDAGAWIAIAAIVLIVGGALLYIVKAKKNGRKCIGCPYSGNCGSHGCTVCADPSKKEDQAHSKE